MNRGIGRFASYVLAFGILAIWCISAIVLDQALFSAQRSRDLMKLGAANGELLTTHEWWRLLTSQFLHVHFLHMLFNAACIAIVGAAVEKAYKWQGLLVVYLIGGTAGQYASVAVLPALVSSGASQALMALCAATILMANSPIRFLALTIVAIQAALDLYVSGTIKIGHSVGFIAGLIIAFGVLMLGRLRKSE